MLRWLYHDMSVCDRERLIKFILCTAAGFLFAYLIHDPYAATTAVTANLILYIDRGFLGSIRYGWKRLEVQIIQGGLTLLLIYIMKYSLRLPVHDTCIAIISCSIAILIGLPLNYKHQISPYNTTLANATFIMAGGLLKNLQFYPARLIHCLVGAIIGLLINWFIMPQHDRYLESLDEILACGDHFYGEIMRVCRPGSDPPAGLSKKKLAEVRELLAKNIVFLPQDNGHIPFRKAVPDEQLKRLIAISDSVDILEEMLMDVHIYREELSLGFLEAYCAELDLVQTVQRKAVLNLREYRIDSFPLKQEPVVWEPHGRGEIILAADLIRLREALSITNVP